MYSILVCKETWSYDALDAGEPDEAWLDDTIAMDLDAYDIADGLTIVDTTVDYLSNRVTYASASEFHDGIWYFTYDTDYRTGDETQTSYHLYDYTIAEQHAIYNRLKAERYIV